MFFFFLDLLLLGTTHPFWREREREVICNGKGRICEDRGSKTTFPFFFPDVWNLEKVKTARSVGGKEQNILGEKLFGWTWFPEE